MAIITAIRRSPLERWSARSISGSVRRQHHHRKDVVNIRLFLVADHAIVRDGLRAQLVSQTDIRVIGDAQNGRTALQAVERLRPDVVILNTPISIHADTIRDP